jgi:CheY-like chemotaxis protein/phosphoribosyl 1,2-cyclic phosphodiesterase
MRIRFWGTRGSLARPGPDTVRYGGNTSCVEVRGPDDTLIVLDCGTGAWDLGRTLLAQGGPIRGHLLITHTHWDHIQGFPFFGPLFVPGNEWDVYAPQGLGQRIEATLAGQMEYAYFPVTLAQLGASIRFHDLEERPFDIGAVRVTPRYLNHPGLAMGYRLEAGGATLVYATDHEPHSPHGGGPGEPPAHAEDRGHIEFLSGAQLVIHDSQYTLEEYPGKVSWGHSPAERAVDFAVAAGAQRLALFHHDPARSDDALDEVVEVCRRRVAMGGSTLDVFAAFEGQTIELASAGAAPPRPAPDLPAGQRAALPAPEDTTLLIVDDDLEVIELLMETFETEGFRLLSATDGDTALAMARVERPDLVLLDWSLPGRSGLEVCRALRAEPDAKLRQVPVVMLTGQTEATHTAAGFAAGVSDYVVKPFKPTHVRARVAAWLQRSRAGSR